MIKNLVFDLGNVLVEFKPQDYLKRLGFQENDIKQLTQLIFKDKRWTEFDRGTLKIEDYVAALKSENPHYAEDFDTIFSDNWPRKFLTQKTESIAFLKSASRHYNIYVLSNVSEYVLDYIKTLDFWGNIQAGTYSYQIGSCKPESKIYQRFLQDNNLNPRECLFLDDLPQNIIAAQAHNMNGIVFKDNLPDVINYLKKDKKPDFEDPSM